MTEKTVQERWQRIDELRKKLTKLQSEFLSARMTTTTDKAAAEIAECSAPSVCRWKKDELFTEAYTLIVEDLGYGKVLHTTAKKDIILNQIDTITRLLPAIVQEEIQIALSGEKESDRLRAITDLYDRVGFTAAENMPVGKHNQIFVQMLNLMAPQIRDEAGRRGIPEHVDTRDVLDAVVRDMGEEE